MRKRGIGRGALALALAGLVGAGGLVAATTQVSARSSTAEGTVTMANQPSTNFEDILPIVPTTIANVTSLNTVRLMYLPLYQFIGGSSSGSFSPQLSLADAPVYSNGGRTATIRLKPYMWSNGTPVTARDAEFWENLLVANKTVWSEYVPGEYPDNVSSFTVTGARTFSITFNAVYNQSWLLRNTLAWITPMPQANWDITQAGQTPGNYDQSASGAKAVYTYLAGESTKQNTYTSNPLWKIVDGPFRLSAYSTSTGYTELVPNRSYSGPDKSKIARFEELPYTSTSAEFSALRAGEVDYGYLPADDVNQAGYFSAHGFHVDPWYASEINFIVLNYANSKVGPIFKQLYIRQALQYLLNESQYVKDILHGFGHPTYGPVPSYPASTYVSSGESNPAYAYDPSKAATLLKEHGWKKNGSGVLVCDRVGATSDECGAGITSGQALSLSILYTTGSPSGTDEMEVFKSELDSEGIQLSESSLPFDSIFGDLTPGASSWDMAWWGGSNSAWNFLQDYPIPSQILGSGGSFNLGEYSSAKMDADIAAAQTGNGLTGLHELENYSAQQVSNLWVPIQPYQISVVKSDLKGGLPQSSAEMVQPELWSIG